MKRQRESTEKEEEEEVKKHDYAGIFNLLFEFAGPEDDFVFAFVVHGLAHLAFVPGSDGYERPTLADIARTNRFFYRAYHRAHRTIVFPELDKRFDAFAKAYEAWAPQNIGTKNDPYYFFEPLQFKGTARYSRPVVAQLSVLHWLAQHRYHAPMSPKTRANIDVAVSAYRWISWFQEGIQNDADWNVLGRPWHEHDMPTLACAAVAKSHRCVDGAINALMWAYIDDSCRAKQREFITVWIFFGMTASLWNRHCVVHSFWTGWTNDMVLEDKIWDRLIRNRSSYGSSLNWMYFKGTDDE
jgi:hypothetical protein